MNITVRKYKIYFRRNYSSIQCILTNKRPMDLLKCAHANPLKMFHFCSPKKGSRWDRVMHNKFDQNWAFREYPFISLYRTCELSSNTRSLFINRHFSFFYNFDSTCLIIYM